MKQNGYGGANTLTGLAFEGEVDLGLPVLGVD